MVDTYNSITDLLLAFNTKLSTLNPEDKHDVKILELIYLSIHARKELLEQLEPDTRNSFLINNELSYCVYKNTQGQYSFDYSKTNANPKRAKIVYPRNTQINVHRRLLAIVINTLLHYETEIQLYRLKVLNKSVLEGIQLRDKVLQYNKNIFDEYSRYLTNSSWKKMTQLFTLCTTHNFDESLLSTRVLTSKLIKLYTKVLFDSSDYDSPQLFGPIEKSKATEKFEFIIKSLCLNRTIQIDWNINDTDSFEVFVIIHNERINVLDLVKEADLSDIRFTEKDVPIDVINELLMQSAFQNINTFETLEEHRKKVPSKEYQSLIKAEYLILQLYTKLTPTHHDFPFCSIINRAILNQDKQTLDTLSTILRLAVHKEQEEGILKLLFISTALIGSGLAKLNKPTSKKEFVYRISSLDEQSIDSFQKSYLHGFPVSMNQFYSTSMIPISGVMGGMEKNLVIQGAHGGILRHLSSYPQEHELLVSNLYLEIMYMTKNIVFARQRFGTPNILDSYDKLPIPRVIIISRTHNHIVFSAQLIYPYWNSYLRNTMIHFFRSHSNLPWSVVVFSENDRFNKDANQFDDIKFEQRYLKYINYVPNNSFTETNDTEETAKRAYETLQCSYPQELKSKVLEEAKNELIKAFVTAFDFSKDIPIIKHRLLFQYQESDNRSNKLIVDKKLDILDNSIDCDITRIIINSDYHLIQFKDTSIHIHKLGSDELLLIAQTHQFNNVQSGILKLNQSEQSAWKEIIKLHWLRQQASIYLETLFNPKTSNNLNHYSINKVLPISSIMGYVNAFSQPKAPQLEIQIKSCLSDIHLEKIHNLIHILEDELKNTFFSYNSARKSLKIEVLKSLVIQSYANSLSQIINLIENDTKFTEFTAGTYSRRTATLWNDIKRYAQNDKETSIPMSHIK